MVYYNSLSCPDLYQLESHTLINEIKRNPCSNKCIAVISYLLQKGIRITFDFSRIC